LKISNTGGEPALEISLDTEGFTVLNKEFVPTQESGITTGKGKFDALIDTLSKRLSSIKRHFLASTFEKMLEAVKVNALEKGNRVEQNFSFYLKPDKKEKVWIAF
jgi:RNA binding exosome subunit